MPEETITGSISRLFHNREGFVIAEINQEHPGPRRIRSVLGNMVEPLIGQRYEWHGNVEFDPKYKRHQMRFVSYRTILPDDDAGIIAYLSDHAKWVGTATAKKLIAAFGSDVLEVVRTQPDRVKELNIIPPERVDEMAASLKTCVEYEAATIEVVNLTGGVVGRKTVEKAVRRWGANAGTLIKSNPFILTELHGVGFKTADTIHTRLRLPPEDVNRHAAALYEVVSDSTSEGHTVMSIMAAEANGRKLIGGISEEGWLQATKKDLVTIGPMVAVERIHSNEVKIANSIADLLREPVREVLVDTSELAEDQAAAARMFEQSKVFILHGAPGTGKTFTLARMVMAMERAGLMVGMAAPTGKAAKQMSRAMWGVTGGTAVTIHSLLGPSVNEDGEFTFEYESDNLLPYSAIVIDEASMVDVSLGASLFSAISPSARVLIVGDHYQLPSVGPGAVLRDLLDAGVPHYELKQIKRNAGSIVRACHAIKDGNRPTPDDSYRVFEYYNWIHRSAHDEESAQEVVASLFSSGLSELGFHPMNDVQMMSPVNEKGGLSCQSLNEMIKGIVNPTAATEDKKKLKFDVNDKVVRTKNGLAKGYTLLEGGKPDMGDNIDGTVRVVNGDIGYVSAIDEDSIEVKFTYPDRVVWLSRNEHYLQLAYCLTCHKMQGSETPVAIVPLTSAHAKIPFVNREWLYTALSRAKALLITVGDVSSIDLMIRKVGTRQRQTMLSGELRRLLLPTVKSRKEFDYI